MSTAMPPKNSGERCYAVPFSIHFVLKAEKLLNKADIEIIGLDQRTRDDVYVPLT